MKRSLMLSIAIVAVLYSVPSAALAGLAPDGGTRPLSVLAALLRRPQDLPGLVALARAQGRALGALRRVAATWA